MFTLPADFPHGGVQNIPGMLMKQEETTRRRPARRARRQGHHRLLLIGLSAVESDMQRNICCSRSAAGSTCDRLHRRPPRHPRGREGNPGDRAFNNPSRRGSSDCSVLILRAREESIRPHPEERGRRPRVSKDEGGTVLVTHGSRRALRRAPHHEAVPKVKMAGQAGIFIILRSISRSMHRGGRFAGPAAFPSRHPVAHRLLFFHLLEGAQLDLAHRSRETWNSAARSSRVSARREPAASKMRPALVEHGERVAQRLCRLSALFARGEPVSWLSWSSTSQSCHSPASPSSRSGVLSEAFGAEAAVHVDHVPARDATLRDQLDPGRAESLASAEMRLLACAG